MCPVIFNTIPFTREGIESSLFYKENKEILDNPVVNGYWAWKPYIILNAMNRLNDGDIVLYADCGDMFHPNINKYVDDLLDEDDQCLLLMGGFENGQWTKRLFCLHGLRL